MNQHKLIILICSLYLFACKDSTKTFSQVSQKKKTIDSTSIQSKRTIFLIDHCDNSYYSAVLEEDINKGNDTCKIRINSRDKKISKAELLNIPVDRCSINYCEKDYVAVGFSCGGPCYSQVFVFISDRKNKQFDYAQRISNNTNLIAHIQNEEFEKLIVHNFKNGKELIIKNPDIRFMNYGHMDTLYVSGGTLNLEYQTEKKQTKKKSISLEEILN